MRFTVVLEREADGGVVATVPALPGCVSQGDRREEVIANIREAMDLYIQDCIAAGDSVPQEDSLEYSELVASNAKNRCARTTNVTIAQGTLTINTALPLDSR